MEFKLEKDYYDELILLRRHIHKHAEPSFCEEETTNYICGYLDKLNIDYKRLPHTGLVADIDTGKPGKCIALTLFALNPVDIKRLIIQSFNLKNDGPCSIGTTDYHYPLVIHPSAHDRPTMQTCVDIA